MADTAPAEEPTDSESTSLTLLDELRNNQAEAWARMDRLYRPLIQFWCARRGVARQHVDDICQEVFRVVFQKLDSFRRDRPGDSFRRWLRGITSNLILVHFRKMADQPKAEGGTDASLRLQEVPEPTPADEDDPEQEQAALLHRALELIRHEFSDRDWKVFSLTVVEQLDAPAAAAQLDMSAVAVRKAKSRILRRLNEELGEV